LGDPRIPWIVLLDVPMSGSPTVEVVARRLTSIASDAGWNLPSSTAVTVDDSRQLLRGLAFGDDDVVKVGVHGHGVVVAARHSVLDGLALLSVAGRLLGQELRSSARGVDRDRPGAGRARTLAGRAWEVAARPSARVAGSVGPNGLGDTFVSAKVGGAPRTADLIVAGARAIVRWNESRGVSSRRVSVAVGVSTDRGASNDLTDRSAFLRLRDVERMDVGDVREHLAQAPLQPGGGSTSPGLARVAGVPLRLAAPRLGSTLLVSHLGTVHGPVSVGVPMFYPVTGGGSGLSLGATAMHDSTTITLRSRATVHDDEDLQHLLGLVVEETGAPAQ
jgi:hypothetical protein